MLRRWRCRADRLHALRNEDGEKLVGMRIIDQKRGKIAAETIVDIVVGGPLFIEQPPRGNDAAGSLLEHHPFGC